MYFAEHEFNDVAARKFAQAVKSRKTTGHLKELAIQRSFAVGTGAKLANKGSADRLDGFNGTHSVGDGYIEVQGGNSEEELDV